MSKLRVPNGEGYLGNTDAWIVRRFEQAGVKWHNRQFGVVDFLAKKTGEYKPSVVLPNSDLRYSNCVTSCTRKSWGTDHTIHYPVLDIDWDQKYETQVLTVVATMLGVHTSWLTSVPSTHNFHVYCSKPFTWDEYQQRLHDLSTKVHFLPQDRPLVEEGYARASITQGYSTVRLPWILKEEPQPQPLPKDPF